MVPVVPGERTAMGDEEAEGQQQQRAALPTTPGVAAGFPVVAAGRCKKEIKITGDGA